MTNDHGSTGDMETYRARFRFRGSKKLRIQDHEHRIKVAGCDVVISPPQTNELISASDWLIMNARGFHSATEATTFAHKLRAATDLSSVACRYGINSGTDLPTSGVGEIVRDRVKQEHGMILRDNVHGVDVFPDDPNVRIFNLSAAGTVLTEPEPFLGDLSAFFDVAAGASQKTRDVILLLNYALMNPDPVAQIVFAFSAVEMLGQDERWSPEQANLLSRLATEAENAQIGTPEERYEVSRAIKRGVHKLGLREGVLRLLNSLGLDHLKKDWDRLYGERSTLVHGLAPQPGADYGQLAHKSVSLCGHILLKVVAKEIPLADKHVDTFYGV
jgi:hypothetical protein